MILNFVGNNVEEEGVVYFERRRKFCVFNEGDKGVKYLSGVF